MKVPQFHYSKEYKRAQLLTTIFIVVAVVLFVPFIILMALVGLYNMMCGGQSCDGSSTQYCSPATEPEFFAFVFVWLAVIIGFVIAAIVMGVKAKQCNGKIPYTPEEIADMEQRAMVREQQRQAQLIYIPAYYAHRRGQITFSILAGVCGFVSFYSLMIVNEEYDKYRRSIRYYSNGYNYESLVLNSVILAVHVVGIIFFIVLANRDMILKNRSRVLKESSPIVYTQNSYQQNAQSPYIQNVYDKSPYQQNVQSPYAQSPYQQNEQSPYMQNPYQQNVQSPYEQRPYQQNVQSPYAQEPYQQNMQSPYSQKPTQVYTNNDDLVSNNQD